MFCFSPLARLQRKVRSIILYSTTDQILLHFLIIRVMILITQSNPLEISISGSNMIELQSLMTHIAESSLGAPKGV